MDAGDQICFEAICLEEINTDMYGFLTTERNKVIEKEERVCFKATYVSPIQETDQHRFYLDGYGKIIELNEDVGTH